MKKIFILCIILLPWKCLGQKVSTNQSKKARVVVKIPDFDNYNLVLTIQGENNKDRITKTLKNGQAIFNVTYDYSDIAWIEVQKNLETGARVRHPIPVILEAETVVVESTLSKDSIRVSQTDYAPFYNFGEKDYVEGKTNRDYRNGVLALRAISKGMSYFFDQFDSYNDSIFPKHRAESFQLYQTEFKSLNQRVQAELFHDMISKPAFTIKYLKGEDIKKLNSIYDDFSDINQLSDYSLKILENKMWEINNYGKEDNKEFTDFSLFTDDSESINLSEVFDGNYDYTVFYFWHSSCGPCRIFNRRLSDKMTKSLTENKIKLISINTDIDRKKWKKATEQDAITWTNLFAGHILDDIQLAYRISAYPTKVIFNKNLEYVDFKFRTPAELLTLKK